MALLSDLITRVTEAQYWTRLQGWYDGWAVPVPWKSWALRNPYLALSRFCTLAASETRDVVAYAIAGRYLDYAEGTALRLFAKSQYQIEAAGPVVARGRFLLRAAPGSSPRTFAPGDIVAGTPGPFVDGSQLYVNTQGGSIVADDTLLLEFSAQLAGAAANLPVGAPIELKRTFAGISIEVPPSGPGVRIGSGNSSLIWHARANNVTVEVVNNGGTLPLQITANLLTSRVTVQLRTIAGVAQSTAEEVRVAVKFVLTTLGNVSQLIIECVNGGDGSGLVAVTPSPVALAYNGTWLQTAGADDESDESIKQRCRFRWDTLGGGAGDGAPFAALGTEDALAWHGRQIPAGYAASPVDKIRVYSNLDPATGLASGNVIAVYLAGVAGGLGAADVAAVAKLFEAPRKYAYGERLDVRSVATTPVAVTGTIYVSRASGRTVDQVKSAVIASIVAYQRTLDIGETVEPSVVEARLASADWLGIASVDMLTPVTPPLVLYSQLAVLDISTLAYVEVP